MKNVLFIAVIFLTLFPDFAVFAQNATSLANPEIIKKQFRAGEKLTYNITFANNSSAGYAELQSVDKARFKGRNALQLKTRFFTVEPLKTTLYNLNYEAVTLVDAKTGQTLRYRRILNNNNATPEIFERDFTLNETLPETAPPGSDSVPNSTVSANAQVFDLLAAIYRIRDLNFEANGLQNLKIQEGEKAYDVELKVSGKQNLKTALGNKSCFVLDLRINDEAVNRMLPQVFITADERRLPVLFRLKLPQGEVRVEIAGASIAETKPNTLPSPTPTPKPIAPPRPTPIPQPTPLKYEPNAPLDNDLPFVLGEKLNYKLFLQNQPASAGTIKLQIKERNKFFNNQDGVLLTANASNLLPAAQQLFTPNDVFSSLVNPESLLPQKTEIRLSSTLAKLNQTLYFNQDGGFVADDKAASIQIPNGTYDFLSLAYALRTFRYVIKDNHKVSFFTRNNPDVLTISALRREILDLNGEKIPALLLAIQTDSPEPDKYQIRLWLSDDFQRLPLKFTAQTPLGPIRAELQFEIKQPAGETVPEN